MKFQLCQYKVKAGGMWHLGIAKMTSAHNIGDVQQIVDCDTMQPAKHVWDYTLINTPLSCMDSQY